MIGTKEKKDDKLENINIDLTEAYNKYMEAKEKYIKLKREINRKNNVRCLNKQNEPLVQNDNLLFE